MVLWVLFSKFSIFSKFHTMDVYYFYNGKQISIIFKKKRRAHKGLRGMHGGSGVEGLGEATMPFSEQLRRLRYNDAEPEWAGRLCAPVCVSTSLASSGFTFLFPNTTWALTTEPRWHFSHSLMCHKFMFSSRSRLF